MPPETDRFVIYRTDTEQYFSSEIFRMDGYGWLDGHGNSIHNATKYEWLYAERAFSSIQSKTHIPVVLLKVTIELKQVDYNGCVINEKVDMSVFEGIDSEYEYEPMAREPNDMCFTLHVGDLDVMVNTDGELVFKDAITGDALMSTTVEELEKILAFVHRAIDSAKS